MKYLKLLLIIVCFIPVFLIFRNASTKSYNIVLITDNYNETKVISYLKMYNIRYNDINKIVKVNTNDIKELINYNSLDNYYIKSELRDAYLTFIDKECYEDKNLVFNIKKYLKGYIVY